MVNSPILALSNTKKDFRSPVIARALAALGPVGVQRPQYSLRVLQADTDH